MLHPDTIAFPAAQIIQRGTEALRNFRGCYACSQQHRLNAHQMTRFGRPDDAATQWRKAKEWFGEARWWADRVALAQEDLEQANG